MSKMAALRQPESAVTGDGAPVIGEYTARARAKQQQAFAAREAMLAKYNS